VSIARSISASVAGYVPGITLLAVVFAAGEPFQSADDPVLWSCAAAVLLICFVLGVFVGATRRGAGRSLPTFFLSAIGSVLQFVPAAAFFAVLPHEQLHSCGFVLLPLVLSGAFGTGFAVNLTAKRWWPAA